MTEAGTPTTNGQVETPIALDVRGLEGGYGRTRVIQGISMKVPKGGITVLLGPNGAGKSTILRTISGTLAAWSGSIAMFGSEVTRAAHFERSRMGLCHVPEGRGIFRSLSVRDNLRLQCDRGAERDGIERATSAFPVLGARLRQVAGTLSGGEQQMLALAAAYVRRPRVILVDEPSLGLAPLVIDAIFSFLGQVKAEGGALLIVDQFVTRVLTMASSAYILRKGQIVYGGPADALASEDVFRAYFGSDQRKIDDERE
jgi:branched-chain amino acid transport system ATP-binding protein